MNTEPPTSPDGPMNQWLRRREAGFGPPAPQRPEPEPPGGDHPAQEPPPGGGHGAQEPPAKPAEPAPPDFNALIRAATGRVVAEPAAPTAVDPDGPNEEGEPRED